MKLKVQVPASTANLGPAFDCAAVALNLHLCVSVESRSEGFELSYQGVHRDRIALGDENLIVQAIKRFTSRGAGQKLGARLLVENNIPVGVGLGSSAAAIIAGLLIGAHLSGVQVAPNQILREALRMESHPDNISAALHGGMVVAGTFPTGQQDPSGRESLDVHVLRTEVSPDLHFIAVTPDVPLPTEQARHILPDKYSRSDAVKNLQNSALIAAAFFSGQRLSPEFFGDRIHQPFRAPLVPGIEACLKYRHPDLGGIFLSGAGSSIMAIAYQNEREIAESLVKLFAESGVHATPSILHADNAGAQVHSLTS